MVRPPKKQPRPPAKELIKVVEWISGELEKAEQLARVKGPGVSLRRLTKRIDPRRVNGGVFLGLNGTVVKSHGSSDATGVSAAIKLAFVLAQSGFSKKLAARVASTVQLPQDDVGTGEKNGK